MAQDTDAARDRVLAARAELATQLDLLEGSARAAVDIPAKVRRSPAKAAAVAGGLGFLALKGPQRVVGAARRTVFGARAPMPKSMLPDEIDKTLRSFGDDGDKVRAALERDFTDYARRASKDRGNLRTILALSVARPLIAAGTKAAAKAFFTPDETDLDERVARIRDRVSNAAKGTVPADEVAASLDPSVPKPPST